MDLEDLKRQIRELKREQGFHSTLEQRLTYLTAEIGEVAEEVLKLSGERSGGEDLTRVRERLGMEIYDAVWNLVDLAEIAGVDLEGAFEKKAGMNRGREW